MNWININDQEPAKGQKVLVKCNEIGREVGDPTNEPSIAYVEYDRKIYSPCINTDQYSVWASGITFWTDIVDPEASTKEVILMHSCRLPHPVIVRWKEIEGVKLFFYKVDTAIQGGKTIRIVTPIKSNDIARSLSVYITDIKTSHKLKNFIESNPEDDEWDRRIIDEWSFDRENTSLIQAIKEFKDAGDKSVENISIVEIPSNVQYHILEDCGSESIHENHKKWSLRN